MNYPLAVFVLGIVFLYQILIKTNPVIALIITCLVGVHWFLYRKLYHKFRGPGSHAIISFVMIFVLAFVSKCFGGTEDNGGMFMATIFYIDLLFGSVFVGLFTNTSGKRKRVN